MITSSDNAHLDFLIAAGEWLATQNIGDFERRCTEYINTVFPPTDDVNKPNAWPKPDEIEHLGRRLVEYRTYDTPYESPYRVWHDLFQSVLWDAGRGKRKFTATHASLTMIAAGPPCFPPYHNRRWQGSHWSYNDAQRGFIVSCSVFGEGCS